MAAFMLFFSSFVFSVQTGMQYEQSTSVWDAMVVHFINNTSANMFHVVFSDGTEGTPIMRIAIAQVIMLTISNENKILGPLFTLEIECPNKRLFNLNFHPKTHQGAAFTQTFTGPIRPFSALRRRTRPVNGRGSMSRYSRIRYREAPQTEVFYTNFPRPWRA
jgi:hypothetical protein